MYIKAFVICQHSQLNGKLINSVVIFSPSNHSKPIFCEAQKEILLRISQCVFPPSSSFVFHTSQLLFSNNECSLQLSCNNGDVDFILDIKYENKHFFACVMYSAAVTELSVWFCGELLV